MEAKWYMTIFLKKSLANETNQSPRFMDSFYILFIYLTCSWYINMKSTFITSSQAHAVTARKNAAYLLKIQLKAE